MTLQAVRSPAHAGDMDPSDERGGAAPPHAGNDGPRLPRPPGPADMAGLRLLRSARQIGLLDGEAKGFKSGYRSGWRWGVVCGTLLGALLVAGAMLLGRWS